MPRQQSTAQKKTVSRVMHEFKHGELESNQGGKVRSRKQAVAIAMSEAGSSREQSPAQKKKQLSRSKAKESQGRTAVAEKEGKAGQRKAMAKAEPRISPSSARGKTARSGARKAAATRTQGTGGKTHAELYEMAKRRGIPGRSGMSKAQLERALSAH
ncbi:hypothetical protein IAI18_04690 [Acetobacteraceae bacterium H6797]|nr:hypothetical protein [Acetobacteraceae bacterium H6797]